MKKYDDSECSSVYVGTLPIPPPPSGYNKKTACGARASKFEMLIPHVPSIDPDRFCYKGERCDSDVNFVRISVYSHIVTEASNSKNSIPPQEGRDVCVVESCRTVINNPLPRGDNIPSIDTLQGSTAARIPGFVYHTLGQIRMLILQKGT